MRYDRITTKAEEMGVSIGYAVKCRLRYLRDRMFQEENALDLCEAVGGDVAGIFHDEHFGRFMKLARESRTLALALRHPEKARKDVITDHQIEAARIADIKHLVTFDRSGKATAPCHTDKRPSLIYLSRTRRAWCPVCDRKWSALDWLVEIEGIPFQAAVRQLAA